MVRARKLPATRCITPVIVQASYLSLPSRLVTCADLILANANLPAELGRLS